MPGQRAADWTARALIMMILVMIIVNTSNDNDSERTTAITQAGACLQGEH